MPKLPRASEQHWAGNLGNLGKNKKHSLNIIHTSPQYTMALCTKYTQSTFHVLCLMHMYYIPAYNNRQKQHLHKDQLAIEKDKMIANPIAMYMEYI